MKDNIIYRTLFFLSICFLMTSCVKKLMSWNENPNGANPETANPYILLTTVLTKTGQAFLNLGYGDISGVMQYTQKDGHPGGHNYYDWGGTNSWSGYYDILRTNKLVRQRAEASNDEMLKGISLVIKAMVFGLITDLYGDIPYENALKGDEGGKDETFPEYESQESVYRGILADLEAANSLLSKPRNEYSGTLSKEDVYYEGDVTKWRKLANSLALRYYMRISAKLPQVAKEGIEKIVGNPADYPLILETQDEATLKFPGTGPVDSWPDNETFDVADSSNFRVIKMCQTFIDSLQAFDDPRIAVFADKVDIFLLVLDNLPRGTDRVADTVMPNGESRKVNYLSRDVVAGAAINQDENYVGIPSGIVGAQLYNRSPDPNQAARNPHVSWRNSMYRKPSGPLLKAKLMTASEVHFILAEAKLVYGWTSVDAKSEYNKAIRTSLESWQIGDTYSDYITHPQVAFAGTQKQIMVQKWLSNWTQATESWFDFRRTGFPELKGTPGVTVAPVLPVRFYYPREEQNLNSKNEKSAAAQLENTQYSSFGADTDDNSPWSKPWVIQGTGQPWN